MIPPVFISILFILAGVLFAVNIFLIFFYNNLSIRYLLAIILSIFAALTPALVYFGYIYFRFVGFDVDVEITRAWVRGGLTYLPSAIILSQIHIMWLRHVHKRD